MRQTKTFLKVVLLFVLALNVIMYGAVQASVDSSYGMATDQNNGIIKDSTLQQATPVNFKMDFISDEYDWSTRNGKIVKDGDYLCYTLPDADISNLDETLTITCKDAAVDWQGTRYDLRITISNMLANGYKKNEGKGKNLRIFAMIGSGADRAPWIEGYITSGGGVQKIFTSISYDVVMQIVDKNGTIQNGTFVYAVKDIDISDSSHSYGDTSEGVTLLNGFIPGTLKVRTDSILAYKYAGGGIRITGTKENDFTDKSSSDYQNAAEKAGFSVIANASGVAFNWTSGRNCGTALCDFGQPAVSSLVTTPYDPPTPTPPPQPQPQTTVIAYYRDINDYNVDLIPSQGKGVNTPFGPEEINGYYYTGEYSLRHVASDGAGVISDGENMKGDSVTVPNNGLNNQVIFWYNKKETKIKVYYKDEFGHDLLTPEDKKPGEIPKKDIDGYIYTGVEIVKPTPIPKDPKKNSIKVEDDYQEHEIIFWYRLPQVIVKYVVLPTPTADLRNGTNIPIGPKTVKFSAPAETKTFSKDQIKETGNNYDYAKGSLDGKETKDESISVTNNGQDHEIIFGYTQIVEIKVIGVCTQNNKSKTFKFDEKLSVPVNKTYKASDYTWQGYKLISSGNNVRIKEGSLAWLGETADKAGGTANVSVTPSTYSNQKKQILVIFYYESNYKATVKHIYVNPLTKEETILETNTVNIVPDVSKSISSKSFSNYINLSYGSNPSITLTSDGFVKYGNEIYNVSFIPGEANYTIEFRYTSQTIEVRHEYSDGTPVIPPVIKILDPENPESPIPKKEVVYYQLNGGPKQEPVTTVKVPIKPGQEKQTLVFVYTTPYLVFGEEDPNPDHPYYPDGDTYANTRKKYNTGIFPNKMNNQLIGQSDSTYYWVLDEKGELTIRLAFKHMNDGTATTTVAVKIPFDVYVNGALVSANTPINVTMNRKADNDGGCEVWEGKLSNIQIPVWTQEKEYTIEATADYKHVASDGYTTPITGKATAKVTVIGAVYDFSITNIDGSATTGDQMWKASLFTSPILKAIASMTNKEYETNILPIGQANQQNAKYSYGIKKGTRFYFSVNTKGAKSTSIEITPRFYYFDKAGNIGNNGNPITVRSGNADITTLTRTTSLTDVNRTTAEYQKELAQGRTTYGANTYSNAKPTIFANKVITIGTGLRTPFVNYGKDSTSSKYHEVSAMTDVNRVYRSASHWYADYVIPNNATFYDSSNKQLANDGYVVVGFSIRTKAGNDAYLAYSLYSPFTATKQTEWAYEGAPSSYTLPKTLSLATGKSATPWLRNVVTNVSNPSAFAPVAIYQFSAGNTGTLQNVDSAGTH